MRIIAIIIICTSALLILGCSQSERQWQKAEKENTIEGYEGYIRPYPDGKHVKEAQSRIENIEWSTAFSERNEQKLLACIAKYPQSVNVEKAKEELWAIKSIKEIQPSTKEVKVAMIMGTGAEMVNSSSIENLRRNITGSMTVSDMGGLYIISTEGPDDKLFFELNSRGGLLGGGDLVVPSGEGTVYRFKGPVKNFFKGYTFVGEKDGSLQFKLSKEHGLSYIGGKGQVIFPDGKTIVLGSGK